MSRLARFAVAAVCALGAYYFAQSMDDRRGLVGQVLAVPGEPTPRDAIDVTHVVRPHVPLGMERDAALRVLRRGGLSVEVYASVAYEWLHLKCADCDQGVWGRYDQSLLRGGEAVHVGIGLRNGRVVYMEAHRVVREFSI